MENDAVALVIALISATSGVLVKHFLDRWRDARGRKLDEAQRIAARLEESRKCIREWEAAFHRLRIEAIRHGVPESYTRAPDKH